MIDLLVFAAAQGVQAVRLPPVTVPRPAPQTAPTTEMAPQVAPVTTEAVSPTDLTVRLLPDLVVKDVRIEGDSKVHVLVANEGTAAATNVPVDASVDVGSRRAKTMVKANIRELAAGATQWVEISGFVAMGEPAYPPPPSLELSKATGLRSTVDPKFIDLGWNNPTKTPWGGGSKCNSEVGCIKELHEDNNELSVSGDAIVRGKPD